MDVSPFVAEVATYAGAVAILGIAVTGVLVLLWGSRQMKRSLGYSDTRDGFDPDEGRY